MDECLAMGCGETPAQQQHSASDDEWQVRSVALPMELDHPTDRMPTNAKDSDDGDDKQLETRVVGEENFAKRTSPAQQSLFAAVYGDSGVLSRQGIMNSHVKDTQFFMDMACEDLLADLFCSRW